MNEYVSPRADAERPVAPEPSPRLFVSRGGSHHGAKKSVIVVERGDPERVNGLRPARLSERRELVSVDVGVLDHRPPELADEPERQLLPWPFAEQDSAAAVGRELCRVTESEARRCRGRGLAVQEVGDDLRQRPKRAERADERSAPSDPDQIRVY